MKASKLLAVSAMAALLGFGPAAWAQSVIFDNLSANVSGDQTVGTQPGMPPFFPSRTYLAAQSFLTGSQNWTLASVTLPIAGQASLSHGGFTVHLYDTGMNGAPGTLLATLAGNSNPSVDDLFTYTGTVDLAPNATYWVEAEVASGFDSRYYWPSSQNTPTVGSAVAMSWDISTDNGETWADTTGSWANLLMQVIATPTVVPEPSALAFIGLGSAALLIFRRRE